MALTAHRNRLRSFIQSLHDELQYMKEVIGRDYVVRVITRFCVACIGLFSSLTDQIYQQQVDFHKVRLLACELYARTTSCYRALYWTKNEFSYLRRKLETLVQLERRITDLENMQ